MKFDRFAVPVQVFAKADPRVAQFYETGLVPKELWGFGEDLRKKFHATKSVLLKVQHFLLSCISTQQASWLAICHFRLRPSQMAKLSPNEQCCGE